MKRRMVAVFLTTALILSSLTGCGGGNSGKQQEAATTAAAAAETTTAAAAETTAAEETETTQALPEVPELKGPGNVTLQILRQATSVDLNARPEAAAISEVTGYETYYTSLNDDESTTSLMLQVSSGTDVDMVALTPFQFNTLKKNGALTPLNDLLQVYGQEILSGVSEDSWRAVTDADGMIYGVPMRYPYADNMTRFILCRMDLMEAAGITEVPTTLDEFYNDLVTLKEYYGYDYILTGPGKANAGSGGDASLGSFTVPIAIASAFGLWSTWMVDDDGNVIYITETDGFAEMMEFMKKLMDEGLLDPDWATNTSTTLGEKFSSGQAIMMASSVGTISSAVTALPEADPNVIWNGSEDDNIGYIFALKGADGQSCYARINTISGITSVLRTSDNAADCVNFLNEKVKNQRYIVIGTEGETYEIDEDGLPVPIQPAFDENRLRGDKFQDCMNEEEYAWEWQARARKNLNNWLPLKAAKAEAEKNPGVLIDDPFSLMPLMDNYADHNDTLYSALNDFCEQIMYGSKTLDNLDEFTADWQFNEGEAVREELQEYYDANFK